MAQYRVVKRIQHHGIWHEIGETLEENERNSGALLDAGAIEAVEEPPPPEAGQKGAPA